MSILAPIVWKPLFWLLIIYVFLQKIGLDAVADNYLNEKISPAFVGLLTESEMKTFCLWIRAKCLDSPQRANVILRTSHPHCVSAGTSSSFPACSLIRAFVLDSFILQYPMCLLANSENPDQTVHLRSLTWAFVIHMSEDTFSHGVADIWLILQIV